MSIQCQCCGYMWTNGTMFENTGFRIKNGILTSCPNCKNQHNKTIIDEEEFNSTGITNVPPIPEDFHPEDLIES